MQLARLWGGNEGSALVEGAVLMPLLLVLMFGIYEFSWLFYHQHVMSDGVRSAARQLARSSAACDAASSKWATDATMARMLAVTGSASGRSPRIAGWSAPMIAISCNAIDNLLGADGLRTFRGSAAVYVVTVSSQLSDASLGFFRFLGLSAPVISASHSERVTGPG